MQTALVQWTREIHTGTLFGLPSKIIVACFALLLTVLALTGPLIWLIKLRATSRGRKALAQHKAAKQVRAEPVTTSAGRSR